MWLNTNKNISRPPECGFVLAYNRGKTLEHICCFCRRVWLASVTPHNTLGYHQDIPQHPPPGHRNPILPIYPSHSHPSRKNPCRSVHNCSCSCSCLPPCKAKISWFGTHRRDIQQQHDQDLPRVDSSRSARCCRRSSGSRCPGRGCSGRSVRNSLPQWERNQRYFGGKRITCRL